MASPVTAANLIEGVGEFLKLKEHTLRSLLPKEDRDKGLTDGIASYNTAAWQRAVNDVRDIHRLDISNADQLSDEFQTIIKAAVCHLIVGMLFQQNTTHSKDPKAMKAKSHFDSYRAIIGRTNIFRPSGVSTNIGKSRRLVQA